MDAVRYYVEKARQCRRLSRGVGDARALSDLEALAAEYDAKAKEAEVREDRSGDGSGPAEREVGERH